jgi:hypothetical protein
MTEEDSVHFAGHEDVIGIEDFRSNGRAASLAAACLSVPFWF